jgi:hypothetical protein
VVSDVKLVPRLSNVARPESQCNSR